jgi:hypothetical protein
MAYAMVAPKRQKNARLATSPGLRDSALKGGINAKSMMNAESAVAKSAGTNPHCQAIKIIAAIKVIKGGDVLRYGWMNHLTSKARKTVRMAKTYGRMIRMVLPIEDTPTV